jgi:hypothetical protein
LFPIFPRYAQFYYSIYRFFDKKKFPDHPRQPPATGMKENRADPPRFARG